MVVSSIWAQGREWGRECPRPAPFPLVLLYFFNETVTFSMSKAVCAHWREGNDSLPFDGNAALATLARFELRQLKVCAKITWQIELITVRPEVWFDTSA